MPDPSRTDDTRTAPENPDVTASANGAAPAARQADATSADGTVSAHTTVHVDDAPANGAAAASANATEPAGEPADDSAENRISKAEPLVAPALPIRIEKSTEGFARLHAAVEYAVPGADRYPDFASESLFHNNKPVVVGVTSAVAGEGKTTIAMHLATTIARNNFKKVCLIDMSLGEDKLSEALWIQSPNGLVSVLEGDAYTIQTYQSQEIEGLQIMPSGKSPQNPARAARSPAIAEVLAASRELYDVVVVDLPSVSSGNVMPIAAHLDGIIMVVCAGVTPKDIVASAVTHLDRKRVLGVVMNRVKTSVPNWVQKRFRPWW